MTRRKPPDRGGSPTDRPGRRSFYQKLRRFYAGIGIGYHTVTAHAGAPVKEPVLAARARELHECGDSPEEIAGILDEGGNFDPRQVRRWLHNK